MSLTFPSNLTSHKNLLLLHILIQLTLLLFFGTPPLNHKTTFSLLTTLLICHLLLLTVVLFLSTILFMRILFLSLLKLNLLHLLVLLIPANHVSNIPTTRHLMLSCTYKIITTYLMTHPLHKALYPLGIKPDPLTLKLPLIYIIHFVTKLSPQLTYN